MKSLQEFAIIIIGKIKKESIGLQFMNINANGAACVGCRICMLICANRFEGEIRSSRIRVKDRDSLVGHDVDVCSQCSDRNCVKACSVEAITVDEKTGSVIVDSSECTGCGECASECLYGAVIVLNDVAAVCDLCGGEPRCVVVCPVNALTLEERR